MRIHLLLVLLLPLASAQGVFMTDELTGTTAAGNTSYSMTAPLPPAEGKAYVATAFGALAYTTVFAHTVEDGFTPEGTVTGTAFISCDTQTVIRPGVDGQAASARMEFTRGGTVLATVNLHELRTCDGPNDIWEAVFETDAMAGEEFPAGSTFGLNLVLWVPTGNPGSGAENVYVLVGPTFLSGATGPGLPSLVMEPIEPVDPATFYGNITDGFTHSWSSMRNGTFLFNATIEGPTRMTLSTHVQEGRGSLVVMDANGSVAFDGLLENATTTLKGDYGAWTFNVTYEGFVGDVTMSLAPVPQETRSPTNTTSTTGDGNGTVEDEGAPGVGAFALVATMLVAARRFRRAE